MHSDILDAQTNKKFGILWYVCFVVTYIKKYFGGKIISVPLLTLEIQLGSRI